MRTSWKGLLAVLLVIEVALMKWIIHIQPQCEPCLPGAPCPPCISDDQRLWMTIGGLLPVGVVVAQLLLLRRERNLTRSS